MRSPSLMPISNVLLLLISLCITEIMIQDVFKEEQEHTITKGSIVMDADVVNPLYIFK